MADAKSLDTNGYHTQFVLFTPHDFRGVGADVDSLEIVRFTMPSACGLAQPPATMRHPLARPRSHTHARKRTLKRRAEAARRSVKHSGRWVRGGRCYFGLHVWRRGCHCTLHPPFAAAATTTEPAGTSAQRAAAVRAAASSGDPEAVSAHTRITGSDQDPLARRPSRSAASA